MKIAIGDIVEISRPDVKIEVSINKHGERGVVTEISDKAARVHVLNRKNENNWESFTWLTNITEQNNKN